jgi:ectoine hydroxylase-related dioxygenase (phytanoyl-CoA dioxygenase family)
MRLNSIKNFYQKNGYVVLKNFFNTKEINDLQKLIISEAIQLLNINYSIKSLEDLKLHKALILLKNKEPKLFGAFYDKFQNSAQLYKIFTYKKISNILKLLNQKNLDKFSINNVGIRMDVPFDTKHSYGWHQDRAYYPQNMDGNKGMLIWTPIVNINKKIGPLQIRPQSHKFGFISIKKKKKIGHSPQYPVAKKYLSKFKNKSLMINISDAAFINLNTFHASGKNISNKIRFACQVRYSDLSDKNFLPFSFNIFYSSLVLEKLKKNGFDVSNVQ